MALPTELQNKIRKKYREGSLSQKQFEFVNKAINLNELTITDADKLARQEALKSTIPELMPKEYGDPVETPSKKEMAKGALTAIPYIYPAVTSRLGLAGKIASLASPVVTGLSETGIGLLEGESLEQAKKRGFRAAGAEVAMSGILKAAKGILPGLAKTASKANKNVIDKVIKDPELTKIEPQSNFDIASIIDQRLSDFSALRADQYNKSFNKLPKDLINTPTNKTQKITNFIQDPNNKIQIDEIINLIKKQKPTGYKMDLTSVDRLFRGQSVTPDEIKEVNSLLAKVLQTKDLVPTTKKYLSDIKDKVFETLSDVAPEISEINKKYASQSQKLGMTKQIKDLQNDGLVKETSVAGLLTQIGKSLKGNRYTKEKLIKNLDKIDNELNIPKNKKIETIMKGTVAQEVISEALAKPTSPKDIFYQTAPSMFGALGGVYSGIDPLFTAGLTGAGLVPTVLRTKPVAESLLKGAQTLQKYEKPIKALSKATSKATGQQQARSTDGSLTQSSIDFIKNIRGIGE